MEHLRVAARRARAHFLVAAVLFTVLAAAFGGLLLTSRPVDLGSGPAGSPVAVAGGDGATARIFATGTAPDVGLRCLRSDGVRTERVGLGTPARMVRDGRHWTQIGTMDPPWPVGTTLSCPAAGIDELLVVADAADRWRPFALTFLAAAPVFWLVTLAAWVWTRDVRGDRQVRA